MAWPKGRKRIETPEVKAARYAKISQSQKGRKFTDEHRRKLSEAHRKIVGPLNHNWNPDREEQNKRHKASRLFYGLIGRVLKRSGGKKEDHTEELLGYSALQLRTHIESLFEEGMTWDNHGKGPDDWHLDHVKPVCEFSPDEHPRTVNALSNLRPLWGRENLRRTRTRWHNRGGE